MTGTLLLTSALFLLLARYVWRVQTWKLVVYLVLVVGAELTFLGANLTKVVAGGWLPLVIAALVVALMTTWRRGADALHAEERDLEGPLPLFLGMLRKHPDLVRRVPGVAVFPHPNATTTPLALRTNADFNRVLHDRVILVQIVNENVPHIRHVDRVEVDDLGDATDGFVHVKVHVGFTDSQDIPKGLALAIGKTPGARHRPRRGALLPVRADRAGHRPPRAAHVAQAPVRVDVPQRGEPDRGLPPAARSGPS